MKVARVLVRFAGNDEIFDRDLDTEPEQDEEDIEQRLKHDDALAEDVYEEEMYNKFFNNDCGINLDISGQITGDFAKIVS